MRGVQKGYKRGPMSEEHRRKIAESHRAKGERHWMKRPEVIAKAKETRRKRGVLSNYWLGKKRDNPDYLLKVSLAHRGHHSSPTTEFKKGVRRGYAILGGANAYRNLHKWVVRQLGKPDQCRRCGKFGTGRQMHWANLSGEYKKDISDWERLCVACHYQHDKVKRYKY